MLTEIPEHTRDAGAAPGVLSFPIPLRVLFAAHPHLPGPVLQIVHRAYYS